MDRRTFYTRTASGCGSSPMARCAKPTQMDAQKSLPGEHWLEGTIMVGMSLAHIDSEIEWKLVRNGVTSYIFIV